ncbi:MAG TPA: SIS domain-containing protein [Actinomycetes bacterium]
MSFTADEIGSQPVTWRQAADRGRALDRGTFLPGRRLAVVGCGTSYHMAQAFAALREARGLGEADAVVASEWRATRRYDAVVALSRSGTTTEVVRVLEGLDGDVPSVALSAVAGTPVVRAARDAVLLEFADERSIVQTRFATSALALWRAHLGDDLESVVQAAERALLAPLPAGPDGLDHVVFLGQGWTVGLADEAALKLREAAGARTESYPAMEYLHGPIAAAGPATLVWAFDELPAPLAGELRRVGAPLVRPSADPMASLVLAQRLALAMAEARNLDPDHPLHLTRSVVLPATPSST